MFPEIVPGLTPGGASLAPTTFERVLALGVGIDGRSLRGYLSCYMTTVMIIVNGQMGNG
jgi:hypothetical protein